MTRNGQDSVSPPDDGHEIEPEEMVQGRWDSFKWVFPAKNWSLPQTWSAPEKSPLASSEQTGFS